MPDAPQTRSARESGLRNASLHQRSRGAL